MHQDEAAFGRLSDARRCWAPRGCRPRVRCSQVREYVYAFAAVSPHDGVLDSLVLPVANAQTMSLFLAEVALRHPQEYILMVVDGAGWHAAEALVVPENMRLIVQPPYSPELNPAEHLWDELREKWFSNRVFDSLGAVEDRLAESLCSLEQTPQLVTSLSGFDWIVSIPMKAN